MELNQKLIDKGFRIEKGLLVRYTIKGRKRKNWKSSPRGKSQQFMKEKCGNCGINENLTIHHIIPLSQDIIINEKNCQTLCKICHSEVHNINQKKKVGSRRTKVKKKVRKVPKVNLIKSEILSLESILKLQKDEWGSYRII